MIAYKGYTGVFEFDSSIDAFHGPVVGLPDGKRIAMVESSRDSEASPL
jgi:predicted HicB family RNase H-like nuclease